MLRDLLSSRWFQGCLAFFVLCVGGSLLYSWHVHRTTESDMERHDRLLQGREKQNETRPAETVTVPNTTETSGLLNTPDETTDTPMPDETEALETETEVIDLADAFLPDDMVSEEAPVEEVPISPYGFGPYPEIPADFPHNVNWTKFGKQGELLIRVMVKAWNQGDKFVSASTSQNGRVYLIFPNTVYVKYGERLAPDGTVSTYIKRAYGPDDLTIPLHREDFPAHVQVLDYDTDGIDPYEYLSLQGKDKK